MKNVNAVVGAVITEYKPMKKQIHKQTLFVVCSHTPQNTLCHCTNAA